jgi:CHAT domain-containing protein
VRRPVPDPKETIELPRLAASAEEVRACAASWSRTLLLTGQAASRERLEQAIALGPEVLHLATHILRGAARRDEAFVALSLGPAGRMDMLTPSAIAPLSFRGLVILNGCGSGQGEVLEGAGLLGLTRAWLAGGAKAVVATHWPMTDESGELWPVFYRELQVHRSGQAGPACGAALQRAQRELLAAGGVRSNPSYWARYFAVGKE